MANDNNDILPEAKVFFNRAKMFPQKCSEEFERMLKEAVKEKMLKESETITDGEIVEDVDVTKSKRPKRCGRNLKVDKSKPTKQGTSSRIKKKNPADSDPELLSRDDEKDVPKLDANLPARSKRLLNKLEREKNIEKKRLEEENKRVLASLFDMDDADVALEDDVCPEMLDIPLKISFLSETFKIICNKNEKFLSIYPKVADKLNLKATEILLCFKDENIEMNDTPASLNLKMYEVIECIPYKPEESSEPALDKNTIQVKIQSNDSRKRVEMYVHKLDKMQDIMEKYSQLRKIPVKNLVFEFDGEKVDGSETLEELEIESGSCLDVKILSDTNTLSSSSQKSLPTVVDLDEEYSSSDIEVL